MHLVLLHALPLDGSMWAVDPGCPVDSVLAPTLYGLGDALGDWAAAVLDLAAPGELLLVGCSVGGSCALEIARRAPGRIRALVLVGTKATPRPDPVARDGAVRVLTEHGVDAAWRELWLPLFAPGTDGAVTDRARRMATAQSTGDLVRGVRAFHDREDRADVIRDLPRPIIVVSGTRDRAPGPEAATALARDARCGALHLVEGSGHYVSLERPRAWDELLTRVARRVLDERR